MNKTGLRSFTLCIMSKYINRTLNMVNLIIVESDPFIAEAPKLRFGKKFHIKLPRFGNKLRKSGLDFRWLLNSNVLFCKIHFMSDFFLFLLLFPHFLFSVKSLDCVNVLFAIRTKFNSCLSIACTTHFIHFI